MILSWGRVHREEHWVSRPRHMDQADPAALAAAAPNGRVLAHGMGRSYGDSPLNGGGALLITQGLDRIHTADWEQGWIRAEAGLTLDALLRLAVPKGWFPAVVPGTKFVTLGGAVANDIHGKNHHVVGSFGAHVRRLGLRRSDGTELTLAPDENDELFRLTIGGLGLTGLITWVEIKLIPIRSAELEIETERFGHIDAFFELSEASAGWPYTVAWIDCFAPRRQLGRGLFSRGRFAEEGPLTPHRDGRLVWPVETPGILLNRASISAFNFAYRNLSKTGKGLRQHYSAFFFPLDGIRGWNRLYGARGFFQHHSLLPPEAARAGVTELLEEIRVTGQGSFLAILKNYGPERSPGRLSFAAEGVSLALDFANRGASTHALLDRLDAIVRRRGGRIYPAKDGRMASDFFRESYPAWEALAAARDPAFSSSFWRRVTGLI